MATSPKDFVHLHVHSEFSLLDGASRIPDIISTVKDLGMDAVALTDHGNMYAAVKFYREAKENGIHPIIGCETYIAPASRFDKATKKDRSPYHLTLLAKDDAGYKNLLQLITLANMEGFYQKPRIDKEILKKHSKGLVAMSGCLAGEIPSLLMEGSEEKALKAALDYKEIFGDDFYIELMDNALALQRSVTPKLLEIGKKAGVEFVVTNDSHYTRRQDSAAQDVLLCIQTGKFIDDEDRMRFGSEEFYLKSPQEMAVLFPDHPRAYKNTRAVMEKCNLTLETGKLHLPSFPVPEGFTSFTYLKKLAQEGVAKKYGSDFSMEVKERLEHELTVIEKTGYAPFFLIVQDFINFAKKNGIEVGPGRGSAAGSIVSFVIGITEVDPLKYGLIFERFLNIERVSMPDIDSDFCYRRRQEIIDYVTKKYGSDHVAQIITFGTMAARAAVRDVGRVLRVPLSDVDRIAKMIPAGPDASIDNALKNVREFKAAYDSGETFKNLIDTAKTLEGVARHASVHAAGVVISEKPLSEYVPLQISGDTQIVTQYSMKELETIGLLKMDFLGLRNLTMIAHAVNLIEKNYGKKIDVLALPLDDKKTYDLLRAGNTVGVFQLESSGMSALIKNLKPTRLEDVIALNALYRPGPLESGMVDDFVKRKNGLVKFTYDMPELEPILKETYGVILYQEQVMQIAMAIAGFTAGEADILRHAMGKKKAQEMAKQRTKFITGSVRNGFLEKKATDLFALCEKFAGYGFNKSHSASYSIISYQTAYLKANYPVEFMAALLTSVIGVTDKVTYYVAECHRMGIKILPPSINESEQDFICSEGDIRFGLAAVKNVGFGAIESIVASRKEQGPFTSLREFCGRIDQRLCNKKVIESLIKAGAFDCIGVSRASLLSNLELTISRSGREAASASSGQTSMFSTKETSSGGPSEINFEDNDAEFPADQLLRMEKEMLGLYISDHPLYHLDDVLSFKGAVPISDVLEKKEGAVVKIGGMLTRMKKITTRKNDLMMIADIEDLTGKIGLVIFPRAYEKYVSFLNEDIPILVKGKIDSNMDEHKLICEEIEPLEKKNTKRSLHVEIASKDKANLEYMKRIKDTLLMFPGQESAFIHIGDKIICVGGQYGVTINPALVENIERLAGEGSARIDFEEVEA